MKPPVGTQLDTNHPLYSALSHFWPFWEGAGTTVHDIKDATKNATIVGAQIAWTTDAQGQIVLSSEAVTTNASQLQVPSTVFGPAPCTMEFKIKGVALNPGGTFHYSCIFTAGDRNGMNAWNNGFSAYAMGGDSPAVTLYAIHHVFFVVGSNGKVTWYIDGAKTATASTFTQRTLTRMMNDANNERYMAQFEFVRLWNKALSDAEVASLTSNPYQVFAPTLTSFVVTPSSLSLGTGVIRQLTANATYVGGETANVTATATWTTSDPAVATVSGGMVTAVGVGSAVITATYLGATATVSVSVHIPMSRFRLNGPFESSLKSTEALSQLLGTFAGLLTWSQGQWVLSFAALKEPVLDITDADARGPIQYQAAVSLRDKCNAVKGVYISPDNEWQPSDFPAYINPQYVAEDSGKYGTTDRGKWMTATQYAVNDAVVNGSNCWVCKVAHTSDAAKEPGNGAESATHWDAVTNIIWRDIRLPFTLSASEAQRLAKFECVRSRQRGLKYIAGPRAYAVRPGEIVTVTHARFGWDKKRCEVVSTSLEIVDGGEGGPELHVPLVLREDDPEGYGWIKTVEERDPTPPGPITVTIPV